MPPLTAPAFRWGLIGPGRIAHRFAQAVQRLPGTALVAVAGRDRDRAQAFAARWSPAAGASAQVTEVADSAAALLARRDIDAVYVATPHAFHGAAVRESLLAGMPVLCEKPLVPTQAEAQALVALARERGVFLMEALWTRFLPVYADVAGWLQRGQIGALRSLRGSFGFHLPFDARNRCFDPLQAGGALLDIGVYTLAISRWALEQSLGQCPALTALQATATLAPSGVDRHTEMQLAFEGGATAQLTCSFDTVLDNRFDIAGDGGCIALPTEFWQATHAELRPAAGAALQVQRPFAINGFEGQVIETMRCVRAGLVESPQMPHAESLALAGWMDQIRQAIGVRYPFEPDAPAP